MNVCYMLADLIWTKLIKCRGIMRMYTVHSDSILTPSLFHILLCCSLLLKWFKWMCPSSIYTQCPIMTKRKQNFRNVFKRKNVNISLDISIQTLCYDSWNFAQVHFSWSSLRCFMKSKKLPAELRIVLRHRTGEGYKKIYNIEDFQEHSVLHNC